MPRINTSKEPLTGESMSKPLWKRLNPNHPALQGARILSDDETLRADDLTACVSMLLTLQSEQWVCVREADLSLVGRTVAFAHSAEYGDMDRDERVYTRKAYTPEVEPKMATPLSISIGRDHEFRHILWAMSGANHVLFCTVCDATIDVRDNWQAFNQTHRKCVRVEPHGSTASRST